MTVWVIKHHCPFTIVDDLSLREAFQMLYAKAKVPLANTVSRNVHEVHRISKANVIALLAVSFGFIVYNDLLMSYLRRTKATFTLLLMGGHHPT
jgi:hypothetical protein